MDASTDATTDLPPSSFDDELQVALDNPDNHDNDEDDVDNTEFQVAYGNQDEIAVGQSEEDGAQEIDDDLISNDLPIDGLKFDDGTIPQHLLRLAKDAEKRVGKSSRGRAQVPLPERRPTRIIL